MSSLSRAACEALDAADPLAEFRERFALPEGVIYLDGNSLGPLPRATAAIVQDVVRQQWGEDLITSWNKHGWVDLPQRLGAKIARLIGAQPHEVIVADSISVNLFKLIAAALGLRPGRRVVVSERGNFPTDLYVAQGLRDLWAGGSSCAWSRPRSWRRRSTIDTALLLLTHVDYRTGRMHDMARLTAAAQPPGRSRSGISRTAPARSRSTSAPPGPISRSAAATNTSTAAPGAGFSVRRRALAGAVRQPLTGWLGHAAVRLRRRLRAGPGDPALSVRHAADPQPRRARVRRRPAARGRAAGAAREVGGADRAFIALVERRCADLGLPRDPARRRGARLAGLAPPSPRAIR